MAQPNSQPTLRDALNSSLLFLFSEARFSLADLRESDASDSAKLTRPGCAITLLMRNGEWWMKIGPDLSELYDIDDVFQLVEPIADDAPRVPGYGLVSGLESYAQVLRPHIAKIVELFQPGQWPANRARLTVYIAARDERTMQAFSKSANKKN